MNTEPAIDDVLQAMAETLETKHDFDLEQPPIAETWSEFQGQLRIRQRQVLNSRVASSQLCKLTGG